MASAAGQVLSLTLQAEMTKGEAALQQWQDKLSRGLPLTESERALAELRARPAPNFGVDETPAEKQLREQARARLLADEEARLARAQARVDELRAESDHGDDLLAAERVLAAARQRVRAESERALAELRARPAPNFEVDETPAEKQLREQARARSLADETERLARAQARVDELRAESEHGDDLLGRLKKQASKERAAADADLKRRQKAYRSEMEALEALDKLRFASEVRRPAPPTSVRETPAEKELRELRDARARHDEELVAAERDLADELERVQIRQLEEKAHRERAAADAETERREAEYRVELDGEIVRLETLADQETASQVVELLAVDKHGRELVAAANVLASALERVRLLAAEKEEVAKAQARVDELRAEGVHGQKLVAAERALADALERVQTRQLTERALKESLANAQAEAARAQARVDELRAEGVQGQELVVAENVLASALERVRLLAAEKEEVAKAQARVDELRAEGVHGQKLVVAESFGPKGCTARNSSGRARTCPDTPADRAGAEGEPGKRAG